MWVRRMIAGAPSHAALRCYRFLYGNDKEFAYPIVTVGQRAGLGLRAGSASHDRVESTTPGDDPIIRCLPGSVPQFARKTPTVSLSHTSAPCPIRRKATH